MRVASERQGGSRNTLAACTSPILLIPKSWYYGTRSNLKHSRWSLQIAFIKGAALSISHSAKPIVRVRLGNERISTPWELVAVQIRSGDRKRIKTWRAAVTARVTTGPLRDELALCAKWGSEVLLSRRLAKALTRPVLTQKPRSESPRSTSPSVWSPTRSWTVSERLKGRQPLSPLILSPIAELQWNKDFDESWAGRLASALECAIDSLCSYDTPLTHSKWLFLSHNWLPRPFVGTSTSSNKTIIDDK